jgi:hypothetical protein
MTHVMRDESEEPQGEQRPAPDRTGDDADGKGKERDADDDERGSDQKAAPGFPVIR